MTLLWKGAILYLQISGKSGSKRSAYKPMLRVFFKLTEQPFIFIS